ncbi:MAG TPA: hypothetical protein DCL44_02905 [Elusimicrobia bacterium]|nr:hypothetical protein [Elusimicrobiota bacterium]
MPENKKTCAVIYSGGKDGHLALLKILASGIKVVCLITIDGGKRHSYMFNDLRKVEILKAHSSLLRIPLFVYKSPASFRPKLFLRTTLANIAKAAKRCYKFEILCGGMSDFDDGVTASDFRKAATEADVNFVTPVAALDMFASIRYLERLGVRAVIVGVTGNISSRWLGRELCPEFRSYLRSLRTSGIYADGNDFQTLVVDSPAFSQPIQILKTRVVSTRDNVFLKVVRFEPSSSSRSLLS